MTHAGGVGAANGTLPFTGARSSLRRALGECACHTERKCYLCVYGITAPFWVVIRMADSFKEHFSAYVVIPAPVYFDQGLSARAKLFYGMLSCMSNHKGYCWAKNETMAKYLGLAEKNSDRTVRRLLAELKDHGYIYVEQCNTNGNTLRKIFLDKAFDRPDKNDRPPGQNCPDRPDKNVHQNNIKNNNIPPIVPQGGQEPEKPKKPRKRKRPTGKVDLPPELEESFSRFWAAYPNQKDKQNARLRWLQLEPSEELVQTILQAIDDQKLSDDWERGYIPMPSTWLNNRRWEDEVTPAAGAEDEGGYW